MWIFSHRIDHLGFFGAKNHANVERPLADLHIGRIKDKCPFLKYLRGVWPTERFSVAKPVELSFFSSGTYHQFVDFREMKNIFDMGTTQSSNRFGVHTVTSVSTPTVDATHPVLNK